jgi:hypothetical protein
VDELLQLDPSNTQFLKLKEDLNQLIGLTRALLVQVLNGGAKPAAESTEAVTPSSSSSSAPVSVRKGAIQVGEVVEVTGGERLYAGVVTGIINPTEYKIKYFEYADEVSLPVTSLQRPPMSFYTPEQVQVGLTCQCKYALDQTYYDCKVTAITPNGCVVTYTAYGNSEEVPFAYLKPQTSAAKPIKHGGKAAGKNATSGGLIPIPDSLQILPTDTEKVSYVSTHSVPMAYFVPSCLVLRVLGLAQPQRVFQPMQHRPCAGGRESRPYSLLSPAVFPHFSLLPFTRICMHVCILSSRALSVPVQEIEKKKKELKSIKNKNRLITQETQMVEAQQSWKKFVTKVILCLCMCV